MRSNVLQRNSRPTKKSYRAAIKRIILDLQAQHGLNDEELSERVGCSAGTVANARKEQNNLDGVTLASIEYEFGPGAIDPFLALGMSRGVPGHAHCDTDPNPALKLSEALTALIATQQPGSHLGADTSDEEAFNMLRQLRDGRAVLDALIARGERHLAREIIKGAEAA
jgi:hypothetical protein